jgi:hypothetical protein
MNYQKLSSGLFFFAGLTKKFMTFTGADLLRISRLAFLSVLFLSPAISVLGQNPIISTQFTADPSARVFGDRVYLYPSHDIPHQPGKGRSGWFVMEDYHVFSSEDLSNWTDHGVIVTQNKVSWVKPESYNMWAPDCIFRNGKYYFYFPATPKDTTNIKGFTIGVAVADKPEGPFIAQDKPIAAVRGIDPNVFIDKDGQAYLYWSQGHIYGAKLKDNMLELASEPAILQQLPDKGLKEGPYVFERNGNYYMTYPHVENKIERLEYAIGKNPLGPFKFTGVIMDESATGCWTNHHSIINFKQQWYLFYHHNDLSPDFDKNRSVRIDSLSFNPDGTIKKVIPTLRGVGLTSALAKIQPDRYSKISDQGLSVSFIDTADRFKGWKARFSTPAGWLQYNHVDFGNSSPKRVSLMSSSASGGTLQIRYGSSTGPVLAEIKVPANTSWNLSNATLLHPVTGVKNLFLTSKGNNIVDLDWISFE